MSFWHESHGPTTCINYPLNAAQKQPSTHITYIHPYKHTSTPSHPISIQSIPDPNLQKANQLVLPVILKPPPSSSSKPPHPHLQTNPSCQTRRIAFSLDSDVIAQNPGLKTTTESRIMTGFPADTDDGWRGRNDICLFCQSSVYDDMRPRLGGRQ